MNELRSLDLALRAILLQIQCLNDPKLRLAYEKITEAQDSIHQRMMEKRDE